LRKQPHHRSGGSPPLLGEARKLRQKPPMKGEVSRTCNECERSSHAVHANQYDGGVCLLFILVLL